MLKHNISKSKQAIAVITLLFIVSMLFSLLQVPVFAADKPTRIPVGGSSGTTLEEAISIANSMDSAIIEIIADIQVTSSIIITSDITIIGVDGAHIVSNCIIKVQDGGRLTLGDGTTENTLTILGAVSVTNGMINVKDGIILKSGGYALYLSGPNAVGMISGGRFEGATGALSLNGGAKISEISGGIFYGTQETVYLTDDNTRIEKISGGKFYQTDPDITLHGQTIFVQNNAAIGEISGGYFEAVRNSAILIIRGAWVEKISGGEFVATRRGTQQDGNAPDPWNSVLRIESEHNVKTGVGTISGGLFHGGARFGILVINYFSSTTGARIDVISGGDIQGAGVGLQVDVGCDVGEISGGIITGSQGILNAGTIGKISGNVEISGTTSYGIYNYYTDSQRYGIINEISGGKISSQDERGIANAGTIKLISGGTIIGGGLYGITNRGTITLISGGTIIGKQNAIYCYTLSASDRGVLGTITGGVFWGKTGYAIILSSGLQLEPGLSANYGLGRYQSGTAGIFDDESLVTYPGDYFMSTKTKSVEGISDATFRYLTLDDKYTIDYVLNGGVNNANNPFSYDETDLPCPIANPTRVDYIFQGWIVEYADGSTAGPVLGFSIPEGTTGDIILTARWAEISVEQYTVVYNGNGHTGGTVPIDNNSPYISESQVTVLGSGTLSRTGYTFLGWATSSGANAAAYVAGSTFTITDDVVLYAVWEQTTTPTYYTVTYEPGAHGIFTAQTTRNLDYGDPTPVAPEVTGENGWKFTGWSPIPSATVTGNAIYVAQWEQVQGPSPSASPGPSPSPSTGPGGMVFVVRFVDWDGVLLKSQTVSYGDNATAPESPMREGCTFTGWDRDYTNVTSNLTITAQYAANVEPQASLQIWALVNLVLSVAGLVLAIVVVIWVLLPRKQKQEKHTGAEVEKQKRQRRNLWLTIALGMGIVGIIVFLLTEDLSRMMGLVDSWTIANIIIFAVEIIAIAFIFKRKKRQTQKENNTPLHNNTPPS